MRFVRLLAIVTTLAACSSGAQSPTTLPLSTTSSIATTTEATTTTTTAATTTTTTTTVVPTTVFDPSKYVMHNVEELPVIISPGDLYTTLQDMTQWDNGYGWGGLAQLFVGSQLGDRIEFSFPITTAGTYELAVWLTRAPDFGIVRVTIDGTDIQDVDLYASSVQATQGISMGEFVLDAGPHSVRFTVLGKSPQSSGTSFGIDVIEVIGPQ